MAEVLSMSSIGGWSLDTGETFDPYRLPSPITFEHGGYGDPYDYGGSSGIGHTSAVIELRHVVVTPSILDALADAMVFLRKINVNLVIR